MELSFHGSVCGGLSSFRFPFNMAGIEISNCNAIWAWRVKFEVLRSSPLLSVDVVDNLPTLRRMYRTDNVSVSGLI